MVESDLTSAGELMSDSYGRSLPMALGGLTLGGIIGGAAAALATDATRGRFNNDLVASGALGATGFAVSLVLLTFAHASGEGFVGGALAAASITAAIVTFIKLGTSRTSQSVANTVRHHTPSALPGTQSRAPSAYSP